MSSTGYFDSLKELFRAQSMANWIPIGMVLADAIASKGAYFLHKIEGERVALPWNAVHLKLFNR